MAAPESNHVYLVIFKSETGEHGSKSWTPVCPKDVPTWLKEARHIQAMLLGQAVHGARGGPWYRAERFKQPEVPEPAEPTKH